CSVRSSALPSDGALSKSPSSNAGRWLRSEKNSMRNTRPRSASISSSQRVTPRQKYPATLRLDPTMLLHTAHLSMSLIQIDLAVDFVVLRGLPGDCGRGRRG